MDPTLSSRAKKTCNSLQYQLLKYTCTVRHSYTSLLHLILFLRAVSILRVDTNLAGQEASIYWQERSISHGALVTEQKEYGIDHILHFCKNTTVDDSFIRCTVVLWRPDDFLSLTLLNLF